LVAGYEGELIVLLEETVTREFLERLQEFAAKYLSARR